jgi:hypothetical protein
MAWQWYEITQYKASVGGKAGGYYGILQLFGSGIYASIRFHDSGALPGSSAPTTFGQRFYGHMDFQQMPVMVDLLRNESPVRFGFYKENPNMFHLMTGREPVGKGDGILAEDTA